MKDPEKRITIAAIKQHEWYLHRLPFELCEGYKGFERCAALSLQSLAARAGWLRWRSVLRAHCGVRATCGKARRGRVPRE